MRATLERALLFIDPASPTLGFFVLTLGFFVLTLGFFILTLGFFVLTLGFFVLTLGVFRPNPGFSVLSSHIQGSKKAACHKTEG